MQFKFIDEVCKCGLDLTTLHPERTRDEGAGVCPGCGRTLLVVEVEPEPEPEAEPTQAEPIEPTPEAKPEQPTESTQPES